MSIALTSSAGGILLQETGQPDLLFENKLSSLTEGATSVTIDGMVNKKWTRKDIPTANLSIEGVAFTGTPIELVKKLRDEVFTGQVVASSGNGGTTVDLSNFYTKAQISTLISNALSNVTTP